jgi:hypothetical protein
MKKIVLVSGNRIAPAATGGQVRSIGIASALARMGHTVHIFSTAGRSKDYRGMGFRHQTLESAVEPRLRESVHVGLTFGMMQALGRRLDYPRVWQYHMLARGLVPRRLKQALHEADIVLSDLPYCPPVPGPWRTKPWFLISHNLEHKLLEQGGERERRFAKWMRDVESAAPRTYTDILACAEDDQEFFKSNDRRLALKVPIVRCGVDPQLYVFSPQLRARMRAELGLSDQHRLLIFSASNFGPNYEAFDEIQRFCVAEAEFLSHSGVYVIVVGSVSSASFRRGNLIVTGRVPEIVPYFAASDAGINLVTRGSGSNVKLFEYLAARLPVISTVFGVRGTKLVPSADYLACTGDDLKVVIQRFLGEDLESWRRKAEDVWNRHRHYCDIQNLVSDAISVLPDFGS